MGEDQLRVAKYLKLGEFFCGPGGLALGAITAVSASDNGILKIKHQWANDFDDDTCKTYGHNIANNAHTKSVICEDIRKLDIEKLLPIDIFAYGFPCNDFSIVGEQKGMHGEYGPLYSYGVKVLNRIKPAVFLAENVGGIVSANSGKAFESILDDLESAGNGYELTVHLYKAEEYGVPQTRHRVVIVGIDKMLNLKFQVPAPTHKGKYVTSKEALANIPQGTPNNEPASASTTVVERLKHTLPGENAWTANLPDHLKLNVKGAKMSQIYKRLHPDQPCYTITGSGGGGTHGYHFAEPRPLTNRERARIQSFPDSFYFHGKYNSVRKQIGMAVPPHLSNIIFTAILNTLSGVKYDYINANYNHKKAEQLNFNFKNYEKGRGPNINIQKTQHTAIGSRSYTVKSRSRSGVY